MGLSIGQELRLPILFLGGVVTTVAALSVHAIMLQGFGVPYPYALPRTGWTTYPAEAACTLAFILFYSLARDRFEKLGFLTRFVALFALIAAMREELIRDWFMNLINSNPPTIYPIIQEIPKLIPIALLSILVIGSADWCRSPTRNIAAALAITAAILFGCEWPVNAIFARILNAISRLDAPSLYNPPYDYHILIPAYLTFVEPVIAAFIFGILVWKRLAQPLGLRIFQLTFLIFAVKGPVFGPFINIFYANMNPMTAMLSDAQFAFETLTLGVLTSLTLAGAMRGRPIA